MEEIAFFLDMEEIAFFRYIEEMAFFRYIEAMDGIEFLIYQENCNLSICRRNGILSIYRSILDSLEFSTYRRDDLQRHGMFLIYFNDWGCLQTCFETIIFSSCFLLFTCLFLTLLKTINFAQIF